MATEPQKQPLSKTAISLLLVVLIDSVSFTLIVPFQPFLILAHGGRADMGGLLVAASTFSMVLSAPILGRLSDRMGRRPVLAFTLVGMLISYAMLAINGSLTLLFASRILAGLMGGNIGVIQGGLTSESRDSERGRVMGLFTAAWALGYVIGPALGALVSSTSSNPILVPSLIAGFGTLASLTTVLLWAGSSATQDQNAAAAPEPQLARTGITQWSLMIAIAVLALCQTGTISVTGFFMHDRFGASQRELSMLMLWVAVCVVVLQAAGLPLLLRSLGELKALAVSLAVCALGAALIALTGASVAFVAGATVLFASATLGQTVLNTLVSRVAAPGAQGTIMGRATAAAALGRVVGPLVFGLLFVRIPTSPYFATAVLMTAALVWSVFHAVRQPNTSASEALPARADEEPV